MGGKRKRKQKKKDTLPAPVAARRPALPMTGARRYDAAIVDRLTASWTSGPGTSINNEIYQSLTVLRARSRDLQQNNEYGKHFFSMLVNNVVGPSGIGFQSHARRLDGTLDEMDNAVIEAQFAQWSKPGQCDVTRRLSRTMIERMFVEILARDGEVLVRKWEGYANAQRYALQFIDADLLDVNYNQQPRDGRGRIVMGVEVDDFYAPIGYWLLTSYPQPFMELQKNPDRIFVPADEMIHAFIPSRPMQVRGVPWVHAGMRALQQLGGYREAAVVASRVGAAKMGVWTSEDGTGAPYDGVDSVGNLIDDAEPGRFIQAPTGTSLEPWNPDYPHEQFDAFNKSMLRGLAGAFGVSYFSLNNDLESVNLSSARIGQQNERDMYRFVQDFVVNNLNDNYFPAWLSFQLLDMGLPTSRFAKFNSPSWSPRTWPSPDPLKDAQTAALQLGLNLTSAPRVIRAMGHDPDEIVTEIEQWNARLEALGIEPTRTTQVTEIPDEEDENEIAPTEEEIDTDEAPSDVPA